MKYRSALVPVEVVEGFLVRTLLVLSVFLALLFFLLLVIVSLYSFGHFSLGKCEIFDNLAGVDLDGALGHLADLVHVWKFYFQNPSRGKNYSRRIHYGFGAYGAGVCWNSCL